MHEAVQLLSNGDVKGASKLICEAMREDIFICYRNELQDYIFNNRERLNARNIYLGAREMILKSSRINAVKAGLSIMRCFGQQDDELKAAMRKLALYEDLTVYVVCCMLDWEHANDEIFEIAKNTYSYGRVLAAHYLEPETDEIRRWFLCEYPHNCAVRFDYSALGAWKKSNAREKLFGELTREEFDGIENFIDIMLADSLTRDRTSEECTPEVLARFLEQCGSFELNGQDYSIIYMIREFATDTDGYEEIASDCTDMLTSAECEMAIKQDLSEGSCFELAYLLDIPFADELMECLRSDFENYCHLAKLIIGDEEYHDEYEEYHDEIVDLFRQNMLLNGRFRETPDESDTIDVIPGQYDIIFYAVGYVLINEAPEFAIAGLYSRYEEIRLDTLYDVIRWVRDNKTPLKELSGEFYDAAKYAYSLEQDDKYKNLFKRLLGGETEFEEIY